MGVLVIRALLFGVYIRGPDFVKLIGSMCWTPPTAQSMLGVPPGLVWGSTLFFSRGLLGLIQKLEAARRAPHCVLGCLLVIS